MPGKYDDGKLAQIIEITGVTDAEARVLLNKHKEPGVAIDEYYKSLPKSSQSQSSSHTSSTATIAGLFNRYKDSDDNVITADGTIRLCKELDVDPEDAVMLAVAYELKSPRMGIWTQKGWMDGWNNLRCSDIPSMKRKLPILRDKLGSDSTYFRDVYKHTFEFSRNEGQRSLAIEIAKPLWSILLSHGLSGGALSLRHSTHTGDVEMDGTSPVVGHGWTETRTKSWFKFLTEKRLKGISQDIWLMFLEFVLTIDSRYTNYDPEGEWPSTIDDFVEWEKSRLADNA